MPATANDVSTITPEILLALTLYRLQEELVISRMVSSDVSGDLANGIGEIANVRLPVYVKANMRSRTGTYASTAVTEETIPVKLNMLPYTRIPINDWDEAVSVGHAMDNYVIPQAQGLAERVNQNVLGQWVDFLDNQVGQIGTGITDAVLREADSKLYKAKAVGPYTGCFTADAYSDLLGLSVIVENPNWGTDLPIRKNFLGMARNIEVFRSQAAPATVGAAANTSAGAVNHSGGYAAGNTTLVVDGITGAVVTGTFLQIAGDNQIHAVVAHTETTGNTTGITIYPALRYAVANDAVITFYTPGAVNKSGGYAADYANEITIDGLTGEALEVGQGVAIGDYAYTIVDVTVNGSGNTVGITLNRALDAAISNDEAIFPLPPCDASLIVARQALALVSRQLPDMAKTNIPTQFLTANGLALRQTRFADMDYGDQLQQLDSLMGLKTLQTTQGVVILR